jgi:hypothetical protein
MPAELERKLKASGKRKGLKGEHLRAWIYGTMRRTGWKPVRERK